MPARQAPQPPYVLLFEEAAPGMEPLLISVDDRPTLPLFDSAEKAQTFLESTDFGPNWRPVEVSGAGLLVALETVRDRARYVALSPPPAGEGGMRVEMGRLEELIEALQTGRDETDLFGLGGLGRN
ncbi:MAG: hypothetical protein AVDCRST_MAG55-409 [uncultured Rubrobacteraceae bacterium]|jgi:hypothetical protein|uniref:SseB protein N-terminal domain-containing protein n=1 Tax=uncultured Rubrobacteraceae bacterium TaxID=349277 RepID=A0A6J4NUQ2_9ACTN|nr:MAG: hypothetical protein AVDCRST_MAG55-409 [uncultured Rubrobacteraceae bacterium]